MTDTTKLLPCPFCGHSAGVDRIEPDGWAVSCRWGACMASTNIRYDAKESGRGHVIAQWNRRYHDPFTRTAARDERSDEFAIDDDGNVIVLDTWQRNDESIHLRLMMTSTTVERETIATWTDDQCRQAEAWSCATMLSASDHDDIIVPIRPPFLPAYDRASPSRNPITGAAQ